MNDYFPMEQGIEYRMGSEAKPVLRVIANRFMADNPPVPVTYYIRSSRQFAVSEDYMDQVALHEKFSHIEAEQYVYVWGKLSVPQAGPFHFRFSAWGPVTIWVNGVLSFRTNHTQERFSDQVSDLVLELQAGENSLLFQCISTPLGCGFRIGSSSYKGRRIQFFGPDKEHRGISGFVYSQPFKKPVGMAPELGLGEDALGIRWLPEMGWEERASLSESERIFGLGEKEEGKMVKAAAFACPVRGKVSISGKIRGKGVLWIDGERISELEGGYRAEAVLSGGRHIAAFEGRGAEAEILFETEEGSIRLKPECPVRLAEGRQEVWLYAGPFSPEQILDMKQMLTFKTPFSTLHGRSFWRVDLPDSYIRPFNEGVLYGEWNYPLGVTLYGMIQCGRLLEDQGIRSYTEGHMKKAMDFYEYCFWDKEFYGAAPFHNQLTTMDSLDDCGSFASALLEVMKDYELPQGEGAADWAAGYIRDHQQRLADGTFYRNHSYLPIMNETLWADDMYMSIPFLCRYYERRGDARYLEDAVRQAKQFFSYLYMPEFQIMSHIYDTHYKVQTRVPWGRGNGWVLFSLTELLAVLPEEHPERKELLGMFRTLCQGYLRLQGEEGMWHQVLTMPDSYQETSCTAMFIYSFARGVRYGWLEERLPYAMAALKGWQGLCRTAIDWKGNIYGVCRGSGYSFSKEYYANDLTWNINDTHGTGIVLLAGVELEKMKEAQEDYDETGI